VVRPGSPPSGTRVLAGGYAVGAGRAAAPTLIYLPAYVVLQGIAQVLSTRWQRTHAAARYRRAATAT
jgi:hypothetical protein